MVGATEKETMAGFASRMFIEQCKERRKDLYLVSLKNEEVFGIPCCRSLSEIPGTVDLVVICTQKPQCPAFWMRQLRRGQRCCRICKRIR
ncbi:MAG: CoA-binding protein [Blautia marasmi]